MEFLIFEDENQACFMPEQLLTHSFLSMRMANVFVIESELGSV